MAKNDGYMIERAALLEMLEAMEEAAVAGTENDGSDGTTCILEPVATTTREMEDMIANMPAVRLTRCQDCELWQRADGQKIGKCCHFSRDDLSDFIEAVTYMTNETDFCSSARRIVTDGNDLRG